MITKIKIKEKFIKGFVENKINAKIV